MRKWIGEEEFLQEFCDPDNYEVQHWLRNQSEVDESHHDSPGDLLGWDDEGWDDEGDG